LWGAVLADEALTALEAKEQELAQATATLAQANASLAEVDASLTFKTADVERLFIELKNQTECVSRLVAEVRSHSASILKGKSTTP